MHRSATTTPEIRRLLQSSPKSIRYLAVKYGINPKTVAKWKSRTSPQDLPMGPGKPRVKKLTAEEEGTCIGFRIHTMLPLDDCLYALQLMMPQLTRSGLHRLYQRHGISRLDGIPGRTFSGAGIQDLGPIGEFYVNAADIRTGDGLATMIFAFDRTSKFAFAKLYETPNPDTGPAFLDTLTVAVPYAIETILTGENPLFTQKNIRRGGQPAAVCRHPFELACRRHGIGHEILPFDQPWRIRRAGKTAPSSLRKFHYESHVHLQEHFLAFFKTYNFERRLKTLGGLTPHEFICRCWRNDTARFRQDPIAHPPELKS